MIDLTKKDKDLEVDSPESYFKAISYIESQKNVQRNSEDEKRLLKLIDEVNKYDRLNFQKINNKWLR